MSRRPTRSSLPPARRLVRRLFVLPLAIAVTAAATACGRGDAADDPLRDVSAEGWSPITGEVGGVPVTEVVAALRARLEGGERPAGVSDEQWRRVTELYGAYGQSPLFLENDGISNRARAVVRMVVDAPQDGLSVADYPLAELDRALRAARDGADAARYAEADLLLTATYVAVGEDMLTGQIDPSAVSQGWHIDPKGVDVDSALARTMRAPRFDQALDGLRPQEPGYAKVREELARYRQMAAQGGWPEVPGGETLKPGDRAPAARLQALERRLRVEGLLEEGGGDGQGGAAAPATYDRRLAGAVARFQQRHNIDVDSIVGGQTLESLNRTAEYRARQLAANLERYRWLPHVMGDRYVFVNVPAFRLQAFDAGQETLTMNVVVGAEFNDQATPTFSDSMSVVVFRPYWNVPDNIAEQEIYPKLAENPNYFAERNYEEVTEGGRTWVRQTPGDHNSLGLVKFLFPNDFAIYLHDTPDEEVFKQDVRAASHGCIRLEHPERMAQWVLGWDEARVRQAMYEGEDDQEVRIDNKIPVYIVYFTAYERDGALWWGNDVYDRDRDLAARMAAAVSPDAAHATLGGQLREAVR